MMEMIVPPLLLHYLFLASSALAFVPPIARRQRGNPTLVLRQQGHHASDAFSALDRDPTTTANHDELLWGLARFFGDMVDTDTDSSRFYYLCRPQEGVREHVHFPIRDLAAAWDASKAIEFVDAHIIGGRGEPLDEEANEDAARVRRRLADAVECTLAFYRSDLRPIDDSAGGGAAPGTCLREDALSEPSTVGHSALLLLGLCSSYRLGIIERCELTREAVGGLVLGILSMQLDNGAFCIEFDSDDSDYLRGVEFFPGEAMLSLMSAHELSETSEPEILDRSTRGSILQAMERAFGFYSDYYYARDVDVNYAIWQVLAFAKYHDALDDPKRADVRKYICDMCQEICQSRSWRHQLARGRSFYPNLEVVEIACGLDALAEGIRVAREEEEEEEDQNLSRLFEMHAINALYFLKWAQGQVPESRAAGRGGLGYGGVQVLEQRLDVTGHAISALVKLRDLPVLLP